MQDECDVHDMNSKTDYRKLARHHRGLYFVTPSREEVRPPRARERLAGRAGGLCRHCFRCGRPPSSVQAAAACEVTWVRPATPSGRQQSIRDKSFHPSSPYSQDLYERFLELTNHRAVVPQHVEVAMGRQLELPRTGELALSCLCLPGLGRRSHPALAWDRTAPAAAPAPRPCTALGPPSGGCATLSTC